MEPGGKRAHEGRYATAWCCPGQCQAFALANRDEAVGMSDLDAMLAIVSAVRVTVVQVSGWERTFGGIAVSDSCWSAAGAVSHLF